MNGQRDPNAILNECREIDRGIDTIDRNLERLRFLQQRSIDDVDASQNTSTNRELDALSSETMTLYRNFTQRIKTLKGMRESGDPRNKPQVGKVDRKLKRAINEYQQAETDFRHKLSAQMERQYRIVRPEASEAEVREAIEDTSNNQVFSQAVSFSSSFLTLLHLNHDASSSFKATAVGKHNPLSAPSRAATKLSRRLSAK